MKIKNCAILLLVLALLICCVPVGVFAEAEQTMTKNGDVVLVMDDTGSMKENDPNKAAETAINHFGAATPVNTSNLGVVTFGTKVMAKYGMVKVTDATQKELEDFAARNITRTAQRTDLVVGLKEAVKMLTDLPESDNVQAVIAVTDGANDFRPGEDTHGRTEELSNTELAQIETICQEKNIKIYLIGINLKDKGAVTAYLNGIAATTGGDVKFISTGDELKETIVQYYQELGIVEEEDRKTIEVTEGGTSEPRVIPENVFEAIFTVEHDAPLEVTVTDSDGNALSGDSCAITASDTSTVIKLREPDADTYMLNFKNVNGGKQKVNLVTYFNSELVVDVNVPAEVEPNKDFALKAALRRGGQQYLNEDLLHLKAAATLTDGKDTVTLELPLNGDWFEGTVQVPSEGDWSVSVTVTSGKGFYRTNDEEIIIKSAIPAPTQPQQPAPKKDLGPVLFVILGIVAFLLIVAVVILILYNKIPPVSKVPMGNLSVRCKDPRQLLWSTTLNGRQIFREAKTRMSGCTLYDAISQQAKRQVSPPHLSQAEEDCCRCIKLQLQKNNGKYQIVMLFNNNLRNGLNQYFDVNDQTRVYIETEWR